MKICQHSHKRLIDNIGDYLYFKNQRMGASNLKLIHISSTWDCTAFHNFLPMFQKKKKIFKNWQVYDWRTKWLIMSGYMDLRRPRVYRCSNVGLVFQGHPSNFKVTWYKTSPILTQIGHFRTVGRSQLSNPSDLPCFWWKNPFFLFSGRPMGWAPWDNGLLPECTKPLLEPMLTYN